MLHNCERHLIECELLADADCLNLRFNLILVSLCICDHQVKGQNRVSVGDPGKLFTLLSHLTCLYQSYSPLLIGLMRTYLL